MSAEYDKQFDIDLLPWESPTATISPEDAHHESLEIYRRAKNFESLHLLHGEGLNEPVFQYVTRAYGTAGKERYILAKTLLRKLNYVASDDVLLLLSCTKRARVVIATAGAGKTTSLQVELLVSRMHDIVTNKHELDPLAVDGADYTLPVVLYLNYNKHNVQPIIDKFRSMCVRANESFEEDISMEIESSTVHAFCHKWLNIFSSEVSLPELKIMDDETRKKVWLAVATPRWKKFYNEDELGVDWEILDSLYQYKTESMLDWDEFFVTAKFMDTKLNSDFVKSCINKYGSMKTAMRLLDFTDYLLLMIETLESNEQLRERVQSRYKVIVADENQDFTTLMNRLLLLLYNPQLNRLLVVGDPDQTIYQFRGVSPDGVVDLYKKLEDVELLGLDTNYRCPDKIVDVAKCILDRNILRFKKPILTVKTGGSVIPHSFSSRSEQVTEVFRLLQRIGASDRANIVITYRNNRSAIEIGEELYYSNIPFSILDDQRPFNNIAFRHIRQGLQALYEKDNAEFNKCLFRFLPVSRELWENIIAANKKIRVHHIEDLVIPRDVPQGTEAALRTLREISQRIETAPCSDYMRTLFELYKKYFYYFLMMRPSADIGDESVYALYLERSLKFWTRPYTYEYCIKELQERNVNRSNAVTLSTFHGLKGLEFDYVLALDFNESIFPNEVRLRSNYPENTALTELESENRLCYVLVTRAIKELHLFFLASDPSQYVDVLTKSGIKNDSVAPGVKEIVLGAPILPGDIATSRLNFIRKMTESRG